MPLQPRLRGLSRREVVTAAAAVPALWLAGGCTLSGAGSNPLPGAHEQAADDPDVVVLALAAAEVTGLVERLERVVRERPGLEPVVRPLLRNHEEHAEVLGAAGGPQQGGTPSGTPAQSGAPATDDGASAGPLPRGRARLLTELAAAEQQAADAHLRHVGRALSGQFARLLASISAAETQHATVLREAAR